MVNHGTNGYPNQKLKICLIHQRYSQVKSRHGIVATIVVRQILMKTKNFRNKFLKTKKTNAKFMI